VWWSTLNFRLIGRGAWCGMEGGRSCCRLLSSKCQLFSPVQFMALKVWVTKSHLHPPGTMTNFPFMEGVMEAFLPWKILRSGLWPLLHPHQCKKRRSCLLNTNVSI
jgi:hypothetical protein